MPQKSHKPSTRPLICILAPPECSAGTVYGLFEVFSILGPTWVDLTGDENFSAEFDARIVARSKAPVTCAGGAIVMPHATLSEITYADAAIVPDLAVDPETDHREEWQDFGRWLKSIWDAGGVICSACNGALILANAGLLDGRAATTHWGFVGHFRRFYPQVKLQSDRILVTETLSANIVTAGGLSSWQDLALHVVARFHGEAVAIKAAKLFVFGDRSDGQLPYSTATKPNRHNDAIIAESQRWIAENYEQPNPVTRMVEQSGLASRTFKRRFKLATGFAPLDYVQLLRIEEAKQMLETTNAPIDEVAHEVGYQDPTSFRRLFKRYAGVTPGRYRQRFSLFATTLRGV